MISNTSLIQLSVENTDPQRAAEICNALVSELIIQNDQLQNTRYNSTEDSLEAQLAQLEDEIKTVESEIAIVSEAALEEQLEETRNEIDRLEGEILLVQKEIYEISPPVAANLQPEATLSPNELLSLQENQLALDQLQSSLDFYQEIYLNLRSMGSENISPAQDEGQLRQLKSTLNLYQQLYNNLLESYESVRLARLQSSSNVVQMEFATVNPNPIRPQPIINITLGAILSFMLAVGIIFLIEYMDDTIKTTEQIGHLFELPVIGYIADIPKKAMEPGKIYVNEEPCSPISESFRSLKTSVEFSGADEELKTILVTSVNPGEGKTLVASNLAMVFAQSNQSVMLVDADLRKPTVHQALGVRNHNGLSEALLTTGNAKNIIQRWKNSNLFVIPSGIPPSNPAVLLTSEAMSRFIQRLKEAENISIIDGPPFLGSDAAVLASWVDGIILVVQPGKTRISHLAAALEQLDRVKANIIGVVFNRIPPKLSTYYGGHAYYTLEHSSQDYYYSEDRSILGRTNRAGKHDQAGIGRDNGKKPIRTKAEEAIKPPRDNRSSSQNENLSPEKEGKNLAGPPGDGSTDRPPIWSAGSSRRDSRNKD